MIPLDFVGIHHHRAEFQHIKQLFIEGGTLLPKENRAFVIQLDTECLNQHNRAENDQGNPRNDNVEEPLDELLLKGQILNIRAEHGQIVNHHWLCIVDNHVRKLGCEVNIGKMLVGIVNHITAKFRRNIIDKNGIAVTNVLFQLLVLIGDNVGNFVLLFIPSDFREYFRRLLDFCADDYAIFGRIQLEINGISKVHKEGNDNNLQQENRKKDADILKRQVCLVILVYIHDTKLEISHKIGDEGRN